jgi:hypothetical protein
MNKPTAVIDKSLLQAICELPGDKRDLCFNTLLSRYFLVVPEILVEEVWGNLANPSAGKSLATINMMVRCLLHLQNGWIAEPLEIGSSTFSVESVAWDLEFAGHEVEHGQ